MTESASGQPKPLEWIGSSKKDLLALPGAVRFAVRVFVLHVFQKKSKSGVATPKSDVDLIRSRLKVAAKRAKELEDEQAQD